MSFSVSYDYESARITINALSGVQYYYRAICRTGAASGSGTVVYDSDLVPISSGRSYTTPWFALDAETTYTANVLYYSSDSASSYVGAMGAQQFTTPEEPSSYTIRATIDFNANGGTGAPSAQRLSDVRSTTYGYISTTLPSTVPTRTGYTFLHWLLNGTTYSPSQAVSFYATVNNEQYTLVAQWQESTGGCNIYTSSGWKIATPYIYDGSAWKPAAPYIYDGSSWKPTS